MSDLERIGSAVPHESSNPFSRWPEGRRVGLLVLARDAGSPVAAAGALPRSWSARAKMMAVGPEVQPPFGSFHWVELEDAASATTFTESLQRAEPSSTTVLAALPASRKSERRLKRFQSFLRKLPRPSMTGGPLPPSYRGSLVPSDAQLRALETFSENEPVLTLSMNQYKERAVDPMTGEEKTGREVFQTYFRSSLTTFSRVGARVLSIGRCRGVVAGDLDMPGWDEVWAVSYPSLAAFNRMLQNAGLRSKIGHRIAGLQSSWIVIGQLLGASADAGRR